MKYGIIIGRFQINYPHAGHIQLIERVKSKSDQIIIFIGCSRARLTRSNPLSFEARAKMILRLYPDAIVEPLYDMKSDEVWSNQLDNKIQKIVSPGVDSKLPYEVTLFGGRDSFISYYSGGHKTETVDGTVCDLSATRLRNQIANYISDSTDWREGVIFASAYKYPISFQAVDIAIVNQDKKEVLLGRKHDETLFRFIGGFVDPTDDSLESAARREAREEAGAMELADIKYLGSYRVDDWRYRKEVDKIMTAFFMTSYIFGHPVAGDDIAEVKWFNLSTITDGDVVEEHRYLLDRLLKEIFPIKISQ